MLVRVERHPSGVRVHVGRHRWHHAHSGAALIAVGAWLIFGDRADAKEWFRSSPPARVTFGPVETIGHTTSDGPW